MSNTVIKKTGEGMSPTPGQANTAPSVTPAAKEPSSNGHRVFTKDELEKIKELSFSVDPYIAAWAADRLSEVFSDNYANKKAKPSKITQGMEETL